MTWHEHAFAPIGAVPAPPLWSAMMISRTVETCESIMRGDPVIARNLDPTALRRALRGAPLPEPDEYVTVTLPMLEAIDEAGPFVVGK